MIGRTLALTAACALLGGSGWAQDQRFEIAVGAGWTLSDGVSGQNVLAADGNLYNEVNPKDSFSWNISVGYFFTEQWELEFLYDQQPSTLEAKGTRTTEIGDFTIRGYHGIANYHFGDTDAMTRPFIFFGAGATQYPGVEFTRLNGQRAETEGNTQFSGTAGLGVKVYPSTNAGLRLQARWVPTYIKSDSTGYWCDPYWGCYVTGDAQYSNQFEFTGGITLRF
jgi:outer membrane protein W